MITEPKLHFFACQSPQAIHQTAVWEWPYVGPPSDQPPVLFCAHGLTRNGRDFDLVAQRMSKRYRVLAIDFVGRGRSGWLANSAGYVVGQYVADSVSVFTQLGISSVNWLGTSMGGIVGMVLAAMPNTPIHTLILNDIGPELDPVGLQRLTSFSGRAPQLTGYEQAKQIVIGNSATFGEHSPQHWELFVKHYVVNRDGQWVFNYDPGIATGTQESQSAPVNLWPYYDQIKARTLVIRGALSDLLAADIAAQMTQRGPKAKHIDVPGVGHAPTLLPAAQIDLVDQFLT